MGVLVSNKFDWSEHINKNKSETMRTLGLLRRALSVAPEIVKCLAYKTLCRPKLEYAVVKHIESLETVQSKAVRFFIGNIVVEISHSCLMCKYLYMYLYFRFILCFN